MTDRELKKLSRLDLLELLVVQSRENEKLRSQLEFMQEQIQSREIAIEKAGTLAEAALQLNGVFAAAEAAGAQYLENIRELSGKQEAVCAQMKAQMQAQCEQMLADTREKCRQLEEQTQLQCEQMCQQAERIANQHWLKLSQKMKHIPDTEADGERVEE